MSVDLYFFAKETWAIHSPAQQCPSCQAMQFIMTNRFGSTLCIGCSDVLAKELTDMAAVEA